MEELKRPARGDLRVNKTPEEGKSDIELFLTLQLGDHWPDADLLPVFQYLFKCKHTRTVRLWKLYGRLQVDDP